MRSPKHTAWKKNRKFGDFKGGRMRTKLADNIFHRLHSLSRPVAGQEVPKLMQDNPGADYYFPVSAEKKKWVNADAWVATV
ncbi:MAG: hypothetical protein HQ519_05965 [Planctomycetes bacterium]|nr:hypothetical protein [Planctomycetota bacterium]